MSSSSTTPFTKLTDGIQEVSTILPLLGTEQCEKHIGSALEGGYLYTAATPLSIFGSLGIVKAGITVLIASVSLPKLSLSFASSPKSSFKFGFSGHRWLGARVLDHAGFKLVGTIAPVIGMDKKVRTHYLAETRLLRNLEEKYIDNSENLSVEWRSTWWNLDLIFFSLIATGIGLIPYIHLISKDLQDSRVDIPWAFPILRVASSCLAAICCQVIMQFRIVSLMKNRIIFMTMSHFLIDDLKRIEVDKPESVLQHQTEFMWDEDYPAEECL